MNSVPFHAIQSDPADIRLLCGSRAKRMGTSGLWTSCFAWHGGHPEAMPMPKKEKHLFCIILIGPAPQLFFFFFGNFTYFLSLLIFFFFLLDGSFTFVQNIYETMAGLDRGAHCFPVYLEQ